MPRVALVSVAAARALDEDLAPLAAALAARGAEAETVDWDDAGIDWSRFDGAMLRSTWDYVARLPEFLAWVDRVDRSTQLLNPGAVVRWNTDKHYLAELQRAGVPVVPGRFVEPGADPAMALDVFLADQAPDADFVVKPAVGAGSRDAQRHARGDRDAAVAHIARLLDADRSVLLQPYLRRIDTRGETALMYFDGVFSHAIRKGPLLQRGEGPAAGLFAPERITSRTASPAEREVATAALAALPFAGPLAYARVDLIQGDDGAPVLLELELTEPSLFLAYAPDAAARCAAAVLARL